jgi:hypothetical protein
LYDNFKLPVIIKKLNKYSIYLYSSLVLVYVFTITKAIRLPNDWAEAHWLIGYQFGFIKRGLPGEILRTLSYFYENKLDLIILMSLTIFCLLSIFIIKSCVSIINQKHSGFTDYAVLYTFLASPFVVMSAHLMGYYDHLLYVIVFIAINLKRSQYLIVFTTLLLSVSILIHEISLLIVLPICIFNYIISTNYSNSKHLIRNITVIIAIPIITFSFIFYNNVFNSIDPNTLVKHLSEYDFIRENRNTLVPESITTSFIHYLKTEYSYFFSRILNPNLSINVGVPLFLILFITYEMISLSGKAKKRLFACYLFCVFTPLLLHFIAWDTERISTYALFIAFIGFYSLKKNNLLNNYSSLSSKSICFLFIAACFINSTLKINLMDNVTERFQLLYRLLFFIFLLVNIYFIKNKSLKCVLSDKNT